LQCKCHILNFRPSKCRPLQRVAAVPGARHCMQCGCGACRRWVSVSSRHTVLPPSRHHCVQCGCGACRRWVSVSSRHTVLPASMTPFSRLSTRYSLALVRIISLRFKCFVQLYYLLAVGRKVLWSSACVCLSVFAHCFCPQDISRTGSWITTKFGGWEQGVNL